MTYLIDSILIIDSIQEAKYNVNPVRGLLQDVVLLFPETKSASPFTGDNTEVLGEPLTGSTPLEEFGLLPKQKGK